MYCKWLETKKIHNHAQLKTLSTCINLAHLHSSRKIVSISLVTKIIFLKVTPLVLVAYYHIIRMSTFETNLFLTNRKGVTNQPLKMKHISDVIQ